MDFMTMLWQSVMSFNGVAMGFHDTGRCHGMPCFYHGIDMKKSDGPS